MLFGEVVIMFIKIERPLLTRTLDVDRPHELPKENGENVGSDPN